MAAGFALPFAAVAGAWSLRGYIVDEGKDRSYFTTFLIRDPTNKESSLIAVSDLVDRIAAGTSYYLERLARTLWPFSTNAGRDQLLILGILISIVVFLGFALVVRKRRGAPEFFTVAYVALILIWGFHEARFLIPLYPMIIYYLVKGVEGLVSGAALVIPVLKRPLVFNIGLSLLPVIMLASNLTADLRILKNASKTRQLRGMEINPSFHMIAKNEKMRRLLDLCKYLRKNAGVNEVILARKPRLVGIASDRPTVGGPFDLDPDKFVADLEERNVTYLVLDEVYKETQEYLVPAIRAHSERFRVVYRHRNTNSMVIKFLRLALKAESHSTR
jgi:hypothetical protein